MQRCSSFEEGQCMNLQESIKGEEFTVVFQPFFLLAKRKDQIIDDYT